MMMFVTPAWKRYELTAVCLEQRKRVIDFLASHRIEARCVVVADDDNLDIADSLGFDTVHQRNDRGLGRKFNDGMEYAGRQGADWIVPIGSDSWIHPDYFIPTPGPSARSSHFYSVVKADRMAELYIRTPRGVGPYMLPKAAMPKDFRPARDDLNRYIDSSTLNGLRRKPAWEHRDIDPLQYVGFRGQPHITSYDGLVRAWGVQESDPWTKLADLYPADLVSRVKAIL